MSLTNTAEAPVDGAALTPRLLLTIEQTSQTLSLGKTTIFGLIKAGELEAVKIGRATRVPLVAAEEFVSRRMRQAT